MASITGHVEVPSSLPPAKVFKVFSDFDNVAPKADPQTIKSINIIEGDGGVGTIKNYIYGDGKSSKVKVDSIDTSNLSLSYTYFESEAFVGLIRKITHHITFILSLDGGSVYKNIFVVISKPDAKLPEDQIDRAKEALKKTFKTIESYVIAHPKAY